jgi:SSS family solute:Na+ symporter
VPFVPANYTIRDLRKWHKHSELLLNSHFALIDWLLVIGFLIFYAFLGVRARMHSSSLDEFLVMGRRLGPVWGVATMAATETGLITLIYFSEEAYLSGFVAFSIAALAALTMWAVGRTGLVISRLRALEVRTMPEFMEGRFNTRVRSITGLAAFVVGVLNMGIFLQVESWFMAILMGIPESRILVVMAVMLVIVIAYTMLGGMYSVVLTDVVQFIMIVAGAGVTTYCIVASAGGWSRMVEAVHVHYGSAGFNIWNARRYGMLFLSFTTLYYLSGWSSWQPVVARVLSMKDIQMALKLYRLSSLFMFMRAALPMIWGIGALTILGTIGQSNTALPVTLARILPAGLLGVVTIGFISASMSTYSSYLLAFSSILIQDVVGPNRKKPLNERQRFRCTQLGVLLVGMFVYMWGAFYHLPESVFRYLTLTGALSYAATLTVLVGGIYWKRANARGAYWAFLGSAAPPIACLAMPGIDPTHAGLLSFVLAPIGLMAGSLTSAKGRDPRGIGMND